MVAIAEKSGAQQRAEEEIQKEREGLGPFVAAADTTRMPMIFTDARIAANPIIFANRSFLKLTGYKREEVLGQTLSFVLSGFAATEAIEHIEQAMIDAADDDLELECRRKDGSNFLASIFLSPVRDETGVVVQHFLSFIELTGHVDRLLKERDELNAQYQHAPGFIATLTGAKHCFSSVNTAYETLVGRTGLRGKTVAEALPEPAWQDFIARLDTVYTSGQRFIAHDMPITLTRESESIERRYLNFILQPMRGKDGEVTGIFCQGQDVTDQKMARDQVLVLQDELIHLSRVSAIGTMATTLAHELNQPLTAITNYSAASRHLVDPEAPRAEALQQCLTGISEGATRAGEVIRHLRDMTKRGKPQRSFFDLREAIEECILLVRAGRVNVVQIDAEGSQGLIVEADRVQIQQVLLNLIRNSCEAMADSDPRIVTVRATARSDDVVVEVADTGPGVPLEVARTLFEWSTSSKVEGMGIGLAISKTIIEAHQGRIWLEDSSAKGSCFAFSLPRERREA
jgi:two-component system sensor kinase FixL